MPYTIQGQNPPIAREPIVMNGATYVPLRDVTEALGGELEWDNHQKVASAKIGQWNAMFEVGRNAADVNGTSVTFSGPATDQDGTVWVPADFFQSAFGYQVEASDTTVTITNPNATA